LNSNDKDLNSNDEDLNRNDEDLNRNDEESRSSEEGNDMENLEAVSDREQALYDNAIERAKSAIQKGDLKSVSEATADAREHKDNYNSNLDELNKMETQKGLPNTKSEISNQTGNTSTSNNDSSNEDSSNEDSSNDDKPNR